MSNHRFRSLLLVPFLYVMATAIARYGSENGSLAALVLVVFVSLVSVRIGRVASAQRDSGNIRASKSAVALAGALMPFMLLAMLSPLAWLDMGLFLVMLIPIGFAAYLAAGRTVVMHPLTMGVAAIVGGLLIAVITTKVLYPNISDIRRARTHEAKAAAFDRMGRLMGTPVPIFEESFARAAARGIATSDQKLAEELLMSAAPGEPRDLLMPSIEQIWGAAAYASAGFTGVGLGKAPIGDRGVAIAVSYAENSYSVYVLAEHGWFGGVVVLACYLLLAIAVGILVHLSSKNDGPRTRAIRAQFLVAVLVMVIPAVYVALSNIGVLPITGQNMPFLGLNAWSDVAVCAGVIGMLVTCAIHNVEATV
jgi:cell division protein FtsW (lipid II flippase)